MKEVDRRQKVDNKETKSAIANLQKEVSQLKEQGLHMSSEEQKKLIEAHNVKCEEYTRTMGLSPTGPRQLGTLKEYLVSKGLEVTHHSSPQSSIKSFNILFKI